MVLVGGLLVAAASVLAARGETRLLRLGYLALLAVALPGYIVMRVGAEWIYSKEHLDDAPDATRPGSGSDTSRPTQAALLLLIALIAGGFGVRRLRAAAAPGSCAARLYVSVLLLAAYVVDDLGDGRQAELTRLRLVPAG